jgi:hypothetical protein
MATRQLIVRESLYEGQSDTSDDYAEAHWKMDKFMPDDDDLLSEFNSILDDDTMSRGEKINSVIEILYRGDTEIMQHYFPKGGTVEDFAEYIVNKENGY